MGAKKKAISARQQFAESVGALTVANGRLTYDSVKLHPYRVFGADTGCGVHGRPRFGHWFSAPGKAVARLFCWDEGKQTRCVDTDLTWLVGEPCKRCGKTVECFCAEKSRAQQVQRRRTAAGGANPLCSYGRCAPGGICPATDGFCGPAISANCCLPPRQQRRCMRLGCCMPNGVCDPTECCAFYPSVPNTAEPVPRAKGCCGYWPEPARVGDLLACPEQFGYGAAFPVPAYLISNLLKATKNNDDLGREMACDVMRHVVGNTHNGTVKDAAAFSDESDVILSLRFSNGREKYFVIRQPERLCLERRRSAASMGSYDRRSSVSLEELPDVMRLYHKGAARTMAEDWRPQSSASSSVRQKPAISQ